MAISRLSNSGIKTGVLKYDSALVGYPPVMPAPTAADGGTGSTATVTFSTVSGATGYRAISTPGSFTGTGTTSPVTVSGLSAGTAYTFQIQAQNSVGYGGYSAASNSITPTIPSGYYNLTSFTVSSATTQVSITSIPQDYDDLIVYWQYGSANSNSPTIGINGIALGTLSGVAQTIYTYPPVSTTPVATQDSGQTIYAQGWYTSPSNTDKPSFGCIEIKRYSSTSYNKLFKWGGWAVGYATQNMDSDIWAYSWNSTNAITSLQFQISSGGTNLGTNSRFMLYGVKY